MIALQAGITRLTETNLEWRNYSSWQGCKDAFKNFVPPPITISAPRLKCLHLTTSVGVNLFMPIIDGLTAYTFQEKIQLVQEDGHTSLSWANTAI
jgi:hypothetical protein